MIFAHFATLGRSLFRLAVIYALCMVAGSVIYYGGEIMRIRDQRGPAAVMPQEFEDKLTSNGFSDEQIKAIGRFLAMRRN